MEKRKRKTCLYVFLFGCIGLSIISLLCCVTVGVIAFAYEENISSFLQSLNEINDQQPIDDQPPIEVEDGVDEVYYDTCTYYETEYLDENFDTNIYKALIERSGKHFEFDHYENDPQPAKEEQNFFLANLENHLCRLSNIFASDLEYKVKIYLVKDVEVYADDLGIEPNDYYSFSAFTEESDFIEIFDNPEHQEENDYKVSTLSHELVHIFQFQKNLVLIDPIWFLEGMAEGYSYPQTWLSSRSYDDMSEDEVALDIKDLIIDEVPDLDKLNDMLDLEKVEDYTLGYDTAHLFYLHLQRNYGESKLMKILEESDNENFDEKFEETVGVNPDIAYKQWLGE